MLKSGVVAARAARWCALAAACVAVGMTSGCERASAVSSRSASDVAPRASARDDGEAARDARPVVETRRSADRDATVRMVSGKPMWASSRRGSAEENAQRSFDRNGRDFAASDLDDFVRKAHAFVDHPPRGVETLTRPNGDVLYYDARNNVFAVASRDGVPKAMFKPDQGADYWSQQKSRNIAPRSRRGDNG